MKSEIFSLAIATHSRLLHCELDINSLSCSASQISSGYHYGITSQVNTPDSSPHIFSAVYGGKDVHSQTVNELVSYQVNGSAPNQLPVEINRKVLPKNAGAIHQLINYQGNYFVVNTKHNSILKINDNGKSFEYFIDGFDYDVNHPNSIFICPEFIFVLLHNKLSRESQILVLSNDDSLNEISRHSLWDAQCHNIYIEGNYLYYNASSSKSVVMVDWRNGECVKRINTPKHTKGMSVTKDFVIVGGSDYADRQSRGSSKGALLIFEKTNLNAVGKIEITVPSLDTPSAIGNINEIRSLNSYEQGEYSTILFQGSEKLNLANPRSFELITKRASWASKKYLTKLRKK